MFLQKSQAWNDVKTFSYLKFLKCLWGAVHVISPMSMLNMFNNFCSKFLIESRVLTKCCFSGMYVLGWDLKLTLARWDLRMCQYLYIYIHINDRKTERSYFNRETTCLITSFWSPQTQKGRKQLTQTYPTIKREMENHRLKYSLGGDMLVPRYILTVCDLCVFFTIFSLEARWRIEAASNVPSSQRGGLRRFRPGHPDVTGWGWGICREGCADVLVKKDVNGNGKKAFFARISYIYKAIQVSIAMLDSYMMSFLTAAMPLFSTLIIDHIILIIICCSSIGFTFTVPSLTSPRASSLSFCLGHSGRMGDGHHVPWSGLMVATLPTKLSCVSDVT